MLRSLRAAVLVALVLALAVPAGADTEELTEVDEPTLRTERVYFECGDENKARLVNNLQGDYDTWTTDAPTESVQAGAGCGTSFQLVQDEELNGTWEGTFTGNLDAITVEAHIIDTGVFRIFDETGFIPSLAIDGVDVALEDGEFGQVHVTQVERSETMLSAALRFTITGLGIKPEDGDGEIERTIKIGLVGTEFDHGVLVWGTTEVPSGLTFNPTTLEPYRIRAFN